MADVKGLVNDPRFKLLMPDQQKAAIAKVDPRFHDLSDAQFQQFVTQLSGPAAPSNLQRTAKAFSEWLPSAPAADWPVLGPQFRQQVSNVAGGVAALPGQTWDQLTKAGRAMINFDAPGTAYHIAGAVPQFGPQTQQVATDIGQGNYPEAAGHLLNIGGQVLLSRPGENVRTLDEAARAAGENIPHVAAGIKSAAAATPRAIRHGTIPALAAKAVGGGKAGALVGGAIAAPEVIGAGLKGFRDSRVAAKAAGMPPPPTPLTDVPFIGFDNAQLPEVAQGLGPIRPPVLPDSSTIPIAPATLPPNPPAAGGRGPIRAPITSAAGTVVPAPESTSAIPVTPVRTLPPIPGVGVPVQPPWGMKGFAGPLTDAQIEAEIAKRKPPTAADEPLPATLTPAPQAAQPMTPAPETSGSTVLGPGEGVLRDLGHWEDMKTPEGEPDITGQRLYLNKRFHALSADLLGKKAKGGPVAKDLFGPDATWFGANPISPQRMDAVTRFMAANKGELPTKADLESGRFVDPEAAVGRGMPPMPK